MRASSLGFQQEQINTPAKIEIIDPIPEENKIVKPKQKSSKLLVGCCLTTFLLSCTMGLAIWYASTYPSV